MVSELKAAVTRRETRGHWAGGRGVAGAEVLRETRGRWGWVLGTLGVRLRHGSQNESVSEFLVAHQRHGRPVEFSVSE